jgi:hypothetical protein
MLQPINKNKLNFIVVGTGRCGTVYFAKLLTAVGIPCSHERIFTHAGLDRGGNDSDVSRWAGLSVHDFLLAEASYMAVPFLDHPILKSATIIHAVRDPFQVILSFNNKLQFWHHPQNKWEKFILRNMPELAEQGDPLNKNCYYVVRWNRWIEKQAQGRPYLRVRLEHDEDKLLDFLHVTGRRPKLDIVNQHESWEKKLPPLLWPATTKDIISGPLGREVEALRLDYGYEI